MSLRPLRSRRPLRVATLSVHTSPLDQPGTGDAGGMNVYVVEMSKRLAEAGVEVEIFTRATSAELPPSVVLVPGVTVRHVVAGPYGGLAKEDLPGQLCAVTAGVLRAEAMREPGYYDLVHSHYWLSGQVGWLASERWGVPLVHSMHTLAKVKNLRLAAVDPPEPMARAIGEEQVVAAADRLVANTDQEGRQLVELYRADPARVTTVHPGVDLEVFRPKSRAVSRARLGIPLDAAVLLFVGRIQPLKAPDVLLRAAARLVADDPALRRRLVVAIVGGPSGSGLSGPTWLADLAAELGISDLVRFERPVHQRRLASWYSAADVTAVPSYSESFGLVAVESQACGTPVVAAAVGGLPTAVAHGVTGLLLPGHSEAEWAESLGGLLRSPSRREAMGAAGVQRARDFGWPAAAASLIEVYADAIAGREDRHRLAVAR